MKLHNVVDYPDNLPSNALYPTIECVSYTACLSNYDRHNFYPMFLNLNFPYLRTERDKIFWQNGLKLAMVNIYNVYKQLRVNMGKGSNTWCQWYVWMV